MRPRPRLTCVWKPAIRCLPARWALPMAMRGSAERRAIAAGVKDDWSADGTGVDCRAQELPQGVGQPVEPTYLLLPVGAPVDAVAARRSSQLVSLRSA